MQWQHDSWDKLYKHLQFLLKTLTHILFSITRDEIILKEEIKTCLHLIYRFHYF
jgi:hypothetical protein